MVVVPAIAPLANSGWKGRGKDKLVQIFSDNGGTHNPGSGVGGCDAVRSSVSEGGMVGGLKCLVKACYGDLTRRRHVIP